MRLLAITAGGIARTAAGAAILCGIIACAGASTASAQVPGSPVTASGQPALSGQPYVKSHKRHHKNFYGRHYNSFKHSKR